MSFIIYAGLKIFQLPIPILSPRLNLGTKGDAFTHGVHQFHTHSY